MKKSNWIVYIAAIVISAFLLWLWFFLGFNHVDAPLDLILSIIWWALVGIACYSIYRIEKKRRERVRTCYLSKGLLYNSEAGTMNVTASSADATIDAMRNVISGLEYGFDIQDRPADSNGTPQRFAYIVRTKVFGDNSKSSSEQSADNHMDWKGEVIVVSRPDDDPIPFSNPFELKGILASLA